MKLYQTFAVSKLVRKQKGFCKKKKKEIDSKLLIFIFADTEM